MITVFSAICLPFLGVLLTPVFPRRYRRFLAVFAIGFTFLFSLLCLTELVKGRHLSSSIVLTEWFSLSFIADGLAVFMAVVSSFVAFLICIYSQEYMQGYPEKDEFYFWTQLFVGAMMGLVFSANLILLFCFLEITSVCSWKLIGFYRGPSDLQAADRAFLITFFGSSFMLAGAVFIYITYGTLDVGLLYAKPISDAIAFLLLAGIIAKSAQLPLQTWLPDAGLAPTPVTALLHAAVLVKIGVYVFARLFGLTFTVSALFLYWVIVISVITLIVAGCSALVENNMKRILAYSTISQLGYIILALALNSAVAFKIALVYILAHSLAKAGLFLCCGIIEHKSGTKDINRLGGLLKTMPCTAIAYILCAFSIIGIPPFLGFWPKFMTLLGVFQAGYIFAGILAVAGAVLTLFYLMRLFDRVFLGEIQISVKEERHSLMNYVVLAFGILSLVLGFAIRPLFNLLNLIIK